MCPEKKMAIPNNPQLLEDPREGLKLFVGLYQVWEATITESLRGEEPGLLSRFLELCDTCAGVSQTVLCESLCKRFNVDQSQISRLSKKLRNAGLVRRDIPQEDGRRRLTKLTPEGLKLLRKLWKELNTTSKKLRDDAELDAHIDSLFS